MSGAFPSAFARFERTLAAPRPDAVPLQELLAAERLRTVARRYAASLRGREGQAATSMWSQHYLLALIPCATAAALVRRRDLPLAICDMAAVLTDAGQPTELCLPHDGGDTRRRCPVDRLSPLLRLHLEPVAAALAAAGLLPSIFWANAAAVLLWTLHVIDAPEPDRAAVRCAMSDRCWADGGPNPWRAVIGPDPTRRRICCLRFRLPGVARCPDCPVAPGGGRLGASDRHDAADIDSEAMYKDRVFVREP